MNKIKEYTENRKDDLSKIEFQAIEHTKDLIIEIRQQASDDIEGIKTNWAEVCSIRQLLIFGYKIGYKLTF